MAFAVSSSFQVFYQIPQFLREEPHHYDFLALLCFFHFFFSFLGRSNQMAVTPRFLKHESHRSVCQRYGGKVLPLFGPRRHSLQYHFRYSDMIFMFLVTSRAVISFEAISSSPPTKLAIKPVPSQSGRPLSLLHPSIISRHGTADEDEQPNIEGEKVLVEEIK